MKRLMALFLLTFVVSYSANSADVTTDTLQIREIMATDSRSDSVIGGGERYEYKFHRPNLSNKCKDAEGNYLKNVYSSDHNISTAMNIAYILDRRVQVDLLKVGNRCKIITVEVIL